MAKLHHVRNSFASGELDPALRGQHNLKAYSEGALRIRDMVRRSTGGLERRPGFDDLNGMSEGRPIEFEFSDEQRYVINLAHLKAEVFDLNGVLLCTVAAPWTIDQVDELTFTQNGDVLVITNVAPTQILRRLSATVFSLSAFVFDRSPNDERIHQPYYKFVAPSVTIEPSAATGSITLTSSAALFSVDYVGQRLRIYDAEVEITAVTDSVTATATVKGTLVGKLDIDPFKCEKGSADIEVTHVFHGLATGDSITFSGSNDVSYIPAAKFNSTFTVTVIDEHRYKITLPALSYTVREDANFDGVNENTTWFSARDSNDGGGPNVKFNVAGTPTRAWTEPVINAIRGYPAASGFHEGRLWFAGTDSLPDGIFGSDVLSPYRFDVGRGLDAQSVQGAAGSEDVSRIRHIVSNDDLQFFTALREMVVTTRQGEPITPSNVRVKAQSEAGAGSVQPVRFDGATLFVQENGLSVSEFAYSDRNAKYVAVPVSTLAGHLIRNPRCVATSPGTNSRAEQFAYFVNSDGTVAVFHSLRSENIAGWGLWTLGGGATVRGLCAIGGYVVANVYIRGAYRFYRMAEGGIYCLDGQVRHVDSEATRDWIVAAQVRGRAGQALVSELGFHGIFDIPADGVIELEVPVTELIVGDPFYCELQLLPPAIALPDGSYVGIIQRITRSVIDVINAFSLSVNGKRQKVLRGSDASGAIRALNGQVEVRHLGFSRSPGTVISQTEPLPIEGILSVLEEVVV